MSTPHADSTRDAALQTLRGLLARLDPDSELLVDPDGGEWLVRGDIDPAQLDAAIREAGLSMRVVAPEGGDCCGSCGCG